MGSGPKADIRGRSYDFALRIVRLCRSLGEDLVGRVLMNQVLRSGTSVGANIEEAQGAQSKRDFVAKMSIARKEALETNYWLRLLKDAEIVCSDQMEAIIDESDQIARILTSIVKSGKENS